MAASRQLAGLVGPTAMALTATEILNYHIWAANIPAVTYLNGALLLVAGISIVRAHNVWKGWPVLLTVVGWITLAGGLYRMIAPEARQMAGGRGTDAGLGVLFALAAFLTFKGYWPERTSHRAGG